MLPSSLITRACPARCVVALLTLLAALGALAALPVAVAAAAPPAEAPEERTATSKTFRERDGRVRQQLFATPVHRREAGRWVPVDTGLNPAAAAEQDKGYGWRLRSHRFNVLVKRRAEAGYLRVDTLGRELSFGLSGAAPRPAQVRGAGVRYADVLPGVDLDYRVQPDGVKEQLLLKDASAPSRMRFTLAASAARDLRAVRLDNGAYAFRARGRTAFILTAPWATDAPATRRRAGAATRRQDRDRADHVSMRVEKVGDRFEIELAVDEDWLRAEGRRFPVTVDPTLLFEPGTQSAEFDAKCGACEGWSNPAIWIGTDDVGAYRGAFQFDLSSIPPSAVVTSARFGLHNQAATCVFTTSEPCGARSHVLDVHRMTRAWTSDVTTASQLGFDGSPAASMTLPQNAGDQRMNWDVTSLAKGWVSGSSPNHGVLVKRATEPSDVGGPEVPGVAWTQADGDLAWRPSLEVTYSSDAVRLQEPETLFGNGADVRWDRWDGSSGAAFTAYEVHRSDQASFTPSESTRLATIRDVAVTTYRDTTAAPRRTFSYKVVTNGAPSVARTVTLPADGQARKVLQPGPERGQGAGISSSGGPSDCSNTGAATDIGVGNDGAAERGLLHFDLRDVPAGAEITTATLSTYMTQPPGANALTVGVHRLTAGWTEGTGGFYDCTGDGASWVERTGGVNWTTRGGDYVAAAAATKAHSPSDAPGWDDFDVSGIVRPWVTGTAPNHGFMLRTTNESPGPNRGDWLFYVSDDASAQPTQRPKLAVTYSDPSARAVAPSVNLSTPADGDRVRGTVSVEAAATDDRAVAKVELLVDGAVKGTDTTAPYTFAWDSKTVANGTRTVAARATDDAGNVSTSSAASVTVANSAPPTTRLMSPSTDYEDLVRADKPEVFWRLNEAAGAASAADTSGNGRTGAFAGSVALGQPGLLTGTADKAAKLVNATTTKTTDGRASHGMGGLLGTQLTAEAWVNYTALAATGENRVLGRGWGSGGGWKLSVGRNAAGQHVADVSVNKGGAVTTAGAVVTPGKLHLAGTYDGTTLRLYVNGQAAASAPLAAASLTTAASMLAGSVLAGDLVVDELAAYGRTLTAEELRAHFDVGSGRRVTVKGQHTVQAAAADDGSVAKVEFYVDGNRFDEDASAPFSATLQTLGADAPVYDGTHSLTTRAYDDHGQMTASAPVELDVANGAGTKFVATFQSSPSPQAVVYDPEAAEQERHGLDVTVTNRSQQTWSATDVVVRSRWISPDPTAERIAGDEVPLSTSLAPGASRQVKVLVAPPTLPEGVDKAQYRLQIDLYEKSTQKWFSSEGNQPIDNPVIVNKALRTGLGLEKYYQYEGEQLGGGMQHLLNIANGNSLLRFTPFEAPGRGLSTVIDLTYNSLEKKSESPVGNNFSLDVSGLSRFGNPIDIHPNKADEIAGRANRFVEITDGDGTTHRFVGKQAADGSIYWEEPAGVHMHLRTLGADDPRGRWAFTRPDRITFFYDADGYPTLIEDANGNRISFTLEDTPPGEDPGGPKRRIVKVTDAAGQGATPAPNRSFAIAYYSKAEAKKPQIRGKIRRITDHSGSALDFEYYEDGNLLRIDQRGGTTATGAPLADRSWQFTYTTPAGDEPAIPAAADRVSPSPKTNQSTRLYSVRDPRGQESRFTYLGSGNGQDRWKLASRTDRAGSRTSYAYDTVARVTTVTAPLSRVTKYGYDVEGKNTSTVNAKDERTTIEWSADRHVAKVTQPTGRFKRWSYNANGFLTGQWDELNRYTKLEYQDIAVDGSDTAGRWRAGRDIPHISQLIKKTTPRGTKTPDGGDFEWTFAYDGRGNLTSSTDPEQAVNRRAYNADGTVSQVTDPNGRIIRYPAYDANGIASEQVQEMEGEDRVTRFGHDEDGLLRWVQDPLHTADSGDDPREFRSYFDYDAFHRLGRQSAPKSTRHERGQLIWTGADYDSNDNVVRRLGAHYGEQWAPELSSVAESVYDTMDRPTETERPHDRGEVSGKIERSRISYDDAGRKTVATSPKGVATTGDDRDFAEFYDYDPLDRVLRTTRYGDGGEGSQTRTQHRCYDLAGDLRSVTGSKAKLASVACEADGAPPGTRYTTRTEFSAAHEPRVQIDPLGRRNSRAFDDDGNVETTTEAAGSTTTNKYNGRGEVVETVAPFEGGASPRSITTRYEYDPAGNRKKEISPRAVDSGTTADYVTSSEYNAADELVKTVLPKDGSTAAAFEHREYDANGNLTVTTLPVEQSDPTQVKAQDKTSNTYFDPGWIRTSKDQNPQISYDYRAEGWQTLRVPSDKKDARREDRTSRTTYFADGQKHFEYDRSGKPTEFRYDLNNNVEFALDKSVEDDGQKALQTDVAYDGFDEIRTTVLRQEGKDDRHTSFVYDENGNVAKRIEDRETDTSGVTTEQARRHEYTYDEADQVTVHDDFGRKDAATDDRQYRHSYLATGWKERRVELKHKDGSLQEKKSTDWTYFLNGHRRTLETKARTDAGAWETKESHRLSYVKDGVYLNGHKASDAFMRKSPKAAAKCQSEVCEQTFNYDGRDRLTSEVNSDGTGKRVDYTLDAANNVLKEAGGAGGAVESTYDGAQLRTQSGGGQTSKFHYDDWGSLDCTTASAGSEADCAGAQGSGRAASVEQDYQYDSNDRMLAFDDFVAHKSTRHVHDAFDRPVEEMDRKGTDGPKSKLMSYIGLSDQVAGEESFNGEKATGTATKERSYSYDADGERVAMEYENKEKGTAPKDFSYGQDARGNVSQLLDDAGTAQASYGYTAYGKPEDGLTQENDPDSQDGTGMVDQKSDVLNPYRYSGKRWSPVNEQLDMGARRFAPNINQFIQSDRYDGALADLALATDPLTQNRYGLAGGNPISFVEIDGHLPGFIESAASFGGDFVKGGVKGVADSAKGSFEFGKSAVTNPGGTARGLGQAGLNAAKDPVGTAKGAASSAADSFKGPGSFGEKLGRAGSNVVGAPLKAGKVANLANNAGGSKDGAGGDAGSPASEPYKRPSGATTPQQRESVQGKPCVDCDATTPRQHADHKKPLVEEHYETGGIDKQRMRSNDAVQPQCPTCSNRQGARLSQYSRQMKRLLGFK